jgi:hypothetical protein
LGGEGRCLASFDVRPREQIGDSHGKVRTILHILSSERMCP